VSNTDAMSVAVAMPLATAAAGAGVDERGSSSSGDRPKRSPSGTTATATAAVVIIDGGDAAGRNAALEDSGPRAVSTLSSRVTAGSTTTVGALAMAQRLAASKKEGAKQHLLRYTPMYTDSRLRKRLEAELEARRLFIGRFMIVLCFVALITGAVNATANESGCVFTPTHARCVITAEFMLTPNPPSSTCPTHRTFALPRPAVPPRCYT